MPYLSCNFLWLALQCFNGTSIKYDLDFGDATVIVGDAYLCYKDNYPIISSNNCKELGYFEVCHCKGIKK